MSFEIVVPDAVRERLLRAPEELEDVVFQTLDRLALDSALGESVFYGPLEGLQLLRVDVLVPLMSVGRLYKVGIAYDVDQENHIIQILDIGSIRGEPADIFDF
ncbi:MAG: hypothetical protein ABI743_08860 [bacterium]